MDGLIALLNEFWILGRVLMWVLIAFLVLLTLQMLRQVFSSFRSWKFSCIILAVLMLSIWGSMHLYASAFLAPEPVVIKEQCEPAATMPKTSPEPTSQGGN